MILMRTAASALALGAALAGAQPAIAAESTSTHDAFAKCTTSDPGVMLDTKSSQYVVVMATSPTAAGSLPSTSSAMPKTELAMCRSEAEARGAKPFLGDMQLKTGAMLMSLNALDLSSAQRAKIAAMMHADSMRTMRDVDAILTSGQRAQLEAAMRQMAFPGP